MKNIVIHFSHVSAIKRRLYKNKQTNKKIEKEKLVLTELCTNGVKIVRSGPDLKRESASSSCRKALASLGLCTLAVRPTMGRDFKSQQNVELNTWSPDE